MILRFTDPSTTDYDNDTDEEPLSLESDEDDTTPNVPATKTSSYLVNQGPTTDSRVKPVVPARRPIKQANVGRANQNDKGKQLDKIKKLATSRSKQINQTAQKKKVNKEGAKKRQSKNILKHL